MGVWFMLAEGLGGHIDWLYGYFDCFGGDYDDARDHGIRNHSHRRDRDDVAHASDRVYEHQEYSYAL